MADNLNINPSIPLRDPTGIQKTNPAGGKIYAAGQIEGVGDSPETMEALQIFNGLPSARQNIILSYFQGSARAKAIKSIGPGTSSYNLNKLSRVGDNDALTVATAPMQATQAALSSPSDQIWNTYLDTLNPAANILDKYVKKIPIIGSVYNAIENFLHQIEQVSYTSPIDLKITNKLSLLGAIFISQRGAAERLKEDIAFEDFKNITDIKALIDAAKQQITKISIICIKHMIDQTLPKSPEMLSTLDSIKNEAMHFFAPTPSQPVPDETSYIEQIKMDVATKAAELIWRPASDDEVYNTCYESLQYLFNNDVNLQELHKAAVTTACEISKSRLSVNNLVTIFSAIKLSPKTEAYDTLVHEILNEGEVDSVVKEPGKMVSQSWQRELGIGPQDKQSVNQTRGKGWREIPASDRIRITAQSAVAPNSWGGQSPAAQANITRGMGWQNQSPASQSQTTAKTAGGWEGQSPAAQANITRGMGWQNQSPEDQQAIMSELDVLKDPAAGWENLPPQARQDALNQLGIAQNPDVTWQNLTPQDQQAIATYLGIQEQTTMKFDEMISDILNEQEITSTSVKPKVDMGAGWKSQSPTDQQAITNQSQFATNNNNWNRQSQKDQQAIINQSPIAASADPNKGAGWQNQSPAAQLAITNQSPVARGAGWQDQSSGAQANITRGMGWQNQSPEDQLAITNQSRISNPMLDPFTGEPLKVDYLDKYSNAMKTLGSDFGHAQQNVETLMGELPPGVKDMVGAGVISPNRPGSTTSASEGPAIDPSDREWQEVLATKDPIKIRDWVNKRSGTANQGNIMSGITPLAKTESSSRTKFGRLLEDKLTGFTIKTQPKTDELMDSYTAENLK